MRNDVLAALLALSFASGCDYLDRRDLNRERADRTYRTAMEDYRAGRLSEAVEKLQKVCHDDPANASARFQLACLLQDSVKDYFGAACAYHEYLSQRGDSDKSKLAADRLKDCERELAKALSSKYGLNSAADEAKRSAALSEELKVSSARKAKLEKDLALAMQRVKHLVEETERLKRLMKGGIAGADEEPALAPSVFSNALEVASSVEDSRPPPDLSEALSVYQEGSAETTAPRTQVDTAEIVAMQDAETSTGSALLKQSPGAKERRDAAKAAAAETARRQEEAAAAARARIPDTYVVQEGDTLSLIAQRFYGSKKDWRRIQEINKTIISSDGRVKAGQRLVMPK